MRACVHVCVYVVFLSVSVCFYVSVCLCVCVSVNEATCVIVSYSVISMEEAMVT